MHWTSDCQYPVFLSSPYRVKRVRRHPGRPACREMIRNYAHRAEIRFLGSGRDVHGAGVSGRPPLLIAELVDNQDNVCGCRVLAQAMAARLATESYILV